MSLWYVCLQNIIFIREISPRANLYDLDRGDKEVIKLAKGALVISFGTTQSGRENGNLQVPHKLDPLIPDQLQVNILRSHY